MPPDEAFENFLLHPGGNRDIMPPALKKELFPMMNTALHTAYFYFTFIYHK